MRGWASKMVGKRIKDMWRWQVALAAMRDCRFGLADPARVIRTRSVWPEGATIEFALRDDNALTGWIFGHELRLSEHGAMREAVIGSRYGLPNYGILGAGFGVDRATTKPESDSNVLFVPAMKVGEHRLNLRLAEHAACSGLAKDLICEHRVPMTVRVVPRDRFPMKAERSPELDARVHQAITMHMTTGIGERNQVWLEFRLGATHRTAFGMKLELLQRGAVVGTGNLRATQSPPGSAIAYFVPSVGVSFSELCRTKGLATSIWREQIAALSVRATGDLDESLCDFDAESYWGGSVEVPVSELVK